MYDTLLTLSVIFVVLAIIGLIVVFLYVKPKQKQPTPSPVTPELSSADENSGESPSNVRRKQPSNPHFATTQANPSSQQKFQEAKVITQVEVETKQTPQWQVVGSSNVGLKRSLNEDHWGMITTDAPLGLYIVADGMGGHEGGEIASQVTVDTVKSHFEAHPPPMEDTETWLKEATIAANEAVIAHQADQNQREKMGSTLVMALVHANKVHLANVGDSRGYLLNDTIRRVTNDHSLVQRLVELGQITEEEARTHPQRNVIYSTMGDSEKMHVDVFHEPLQAKDRLLLCSDGLSTMLEDQDILNISLANPDPIAACEALINAANANGGKDNITVVIVQMNG